jgi:hypothetical protein
MPVLPMGFELFLVTRYCSKYSVNSVNMSIVFLGLIMTLISSSLAISTTTTTTSTAHTRPAALPSSTAFSSSDESIPLTSYAVQEMTTVAFWANREGTKTAHYSFYVASVLYANAQWAVYNVQCRTKASKCTDEPGLVSQGPSMFAFTGTSKAFSCTQSSKNAQFDCMRLTTGEPHGTPYTVAANQLVQEPMLVTAGAEKLSGFPFSTTFSETSAATAGAESSAGWRVNANGFVFIPIVIAVVMLAVA